MGYREGQEEQEEWELLDGQKRRGRNARSRLRISPVMPALAAMLALAGCTLGVLIVQGNRTRQREELQQSKDAAIQEQLDEIQLYLTSVDETLATGQLSDSKSYEELSQEVSSMQQNLTEYRENNTISDEAIGTNLDDVIAQLSSIQDNLEEEKNVSQKLQDKTSANGAAASAAQEENRKAAESLQSTVNTQLSDVREDIRRLMKEASGENKAEYQELLAVLDGTDSDLEALEKTVAANHERLQSALSSGLGNISGSVSGLKGTMSSMQETLSGVKEQQTQLMAELQGQQAEMKLQQEQLQSLVTVKSQELQTVLETQGQEQSGTMEEIWTSLESLAEGQTDLGQKLTAANDALNHRVYGLSELQLMLTDQQIDLDEQGKLLKKLSGKGTADESDSGDTAGGSGENEKTPLELLQEQMTMMQENMAAMQETLERIDEKLGGDESGEAELPSSEQNS